MADSDNRQDVRDWTERLDVPPDRRNEARLMYAHFAQLAEACGARDSEEGLAGFLMTMGALVDLFGDSRMAAWGEGFTQASVLAERLNRDDWNKGFVAATMQFCSMFAIEVPSFINDMETAIAQRDAQLHAELEIGSEMARPVAAGAPIH